MANGRYDPLRPTQLVLNGIKPSPTKMRRFYLNPNIHENGGDLNWNQKNGSKLL
jgi:hypothetical protein